MPGIQTKDLRQSEISRGGEAGGRLGVAIRANIIYHGHGIKLMMKCRKIYTSRNLAKYLLVFSPKPHTRKEVRVCKRVWSIF